MWTLLNQLASQEDGIFSLFFVSRMPCPPPGGKQRWSSRPPSLLTSPFSFLPLLGVSGSSPPVSSNLVRAEGKGQREEEEKEAGKS